MPSLVQVIEKGDPAPVGLFGQHAAIIEINGQPGIAAGAGQGQIDFPGGPFGDFVTGTDLHLPFQPDADRHGQGPFLPEGELLPQWGGQ